MQNETIEFKAVKGEDEIAGYMYLEDADDESALHFYNQQGLEAGFYVPKNPYKMNTAEWNNYEKLAYEFQADDMVIQFLVDFATENRTFEREGYTLHINKGATMEAEYERCSKSLHQVEYESFVGKIKIFFNNENILTIINDNTASELAEALSDEFEGGYKPLIKNGYFIFEMPKSVFKDDSSYDAYDADEIINDYLEIARGYLARYLTNKHQIGNLFGDMLEQALDSETDDKWLYKFINVNEEDLRELLLSEGYELIEEADNGITVTIENAEEVLEKTVKASGNSGRVYLPAKWIGREVKVVLLKK